jgi:hypothetical protein
MSKYQLIDMSIILFGVMMAWVCAWKSRYYFNYEQYLRGSVYAALVVILLIIVFVEALRVPPVP